MCAAALVGTLAGCGGAAEETAERKPSGGPSTASADAGHGDPRHVPGVGERYRAKIPRGSSQVVAVYGKGEDSAESTVRLFTRKGERWTQQESWPAHNGRKGWAEDHREGDKRSPVGVFTLSDAGGVRSDPGAALPYTSSTAFTPPAYWPKKTRHDFDYVIAIDYNRVEGTSPLDPTRPEGRAKGGSIWLHRDHGDGTSGCVTLSSAAMRHLLRTLDPDRKPVVVMGDRATLAG
ncbi:L,D-transpeptidase family protein [Streptomyces xiaopingdaonensis]|uniref:L,D-transpeptidase family protein n=1 Tax=Streptomyces xiaopingdaonensis TaxID=1565415 RepID=UPI0002ECB094|nr:L,D-transpeptidase family protein [Streptomyces xiaopingdaonensis]